MSDKIEFAEQMSDPVTGNFYFGNGYMLPSWKAVWNPDAPHTQNGHLLAIGGSGSGKSTLLRKLIAHLGACNKQVYVLDLHGDLETENETCHVFTSRKSTLGLSPFEFDKDLKNGGVNVQVNVIVSTFQKNVITNLGAVQKSVLKQLLIDVYRLKGITDEDESTWENELPTMELLYEMYLEVKKRVESNNAFEFDNYFKKCDALREQFDKEEDEEYKAKIFKKIEKSFEELNNKYSRYKEYLYEGKYNEEFLTDNFKGIDLTFYYDKHVQKSLASLGPYLKELCLSPVFNENKPKPAKGVVRYDISGFTNMGKPTEALFFADIIIQRIFSAVKMRGEYRFKSEEYKKRHGAKCDTFIVVDESKLIMPTGKDKENPYNLLSRLISESRKMGCSLITLSQRTSHFPQEIISNVFTKVVLKINESDVDATIKSLGVKDKTLFKHLNTEPIDGETRYTCLVGTTGADFRSVLLPKER